MPSRPATAPSFRRLRHLFSALLLISWLSGCGSDPSLLRLMPVPALFTETGLPVAETLYRGDRASAPMEPVFYATDRAPSELKSAAGPAYSSRRGGVLRLGRATVLPGKKGTSWAELRRFNQLSEEQQNFPIKVGQVDEYGLLPDSITAFSPMDPEGHQAAHESARRYAREINAKLAKSRSKQIHIYIHGYKTVFENPILTAAELWHYLGNEGVFIAYSWPATPKTLAYFSDAETAHTSARNLREFLHFLSEETEAERINLIGYSAGTRLLSRTLGDLALTRPQHRLSLGTVILLAGDVDRGIVAGHLSDGLLDLVDQFIIYQSEADLALKIARLVTQSSRAGQSVKIDEIPPGALAFLQAHPEFEVIDVSDIDSARKGNGHGYLRSSPWVSSDILIALTTHLSPAERGLSLKQEGTPIWRFASNYPERLRSTLLSLSPGLANGAPKN